MSTPKDTEVEEVVTEPTKCEQETETEPAPEADPAPAVEAEPEAEPEALSESPELSDLQKSVAEFGAEITNQAFGSGGGYAEAKDLYFAALKAENEALKAGKEAGGVDPVVMGEGEDKPKTNIWGRPRN